MLTRSDIAALNEFVEMYPTWWYRIGVCDVSRDFTAAPQARSPEAARIKTPGDTWDLGFSCDSTGTVADAIYDVMQQIEEKK